MKPKGFGYFTARNEIKSTNNWLCSSNNAKEVCVYIDERGGALMRSQFVTFLITISTLLASLP